MSSYKYSKYFFIFTFSIVAIIITTNFLIDPFNIFGTNLLKHHFQTNERFIKIEYLNKNHQKYNSYMFGSSRIGTTDPKIIEKYIPNSKFYNFTVSSANFSDYLLHLEYFLNKGYPIKNLYLQIDILESLTIYDHPDSYYLVRKHPYVTGKSKSKFYIDYLVNRSYTNIKGKLLSNIEDQNHSVYNLQTGSWTKPHIEHLMQKDCNNYVKNELSFHTTNSRIINGTVMKNSVNALKKIKWYCDKNHINLIVFITPHNQHMMDFFLINDYLWFLQQIASITNYYNFSGYNSITTNDCNYYESSHYRPHVGNLIAAKIFNNHNISVPNDFGIYITQNNLPFHLISLKKQIKERDKKLHRY